MKALVTGAAGFFGGYVVRALLEQGVEVRGLSRVGTDITSLRRLGVDVWRGNLAAPESLTGLIDGIDVIYHLASAMYGRWHAFAATDIEGTRWLLREGARCGVRRLVYVGTLGVYSGADVPPGRPITEETPADQTSRLGYYARAKYLAEQEVLQGSRATGPDGVVVRPGLIFGPGRSALLPLVGNWLSGNRVLVLGDGTVTLPLTYAPNAADAVVMAGGGEGLGGSLFNIVDDQTLTQLDYIKALEQATGTSYRIIRLPRVGCYGLALGMQLMGRVRGKDPKTTPYRMRAKLANVSYDTAKARAVLGWTPRVPLAEALEQTFGWHQQHCAGGR